jgi:hypothetical protein
MLVQASLLNPQDGKLLLGTRYLLRCLMIGPPDEFGVGVIVISANLLSARVLLAHAMAGSYAPRTVEQAFLP